MFPHDHGLSGEYKANMKSIIQIQSHSLDQSWKKRKNAGGERAKAPVWVPPPLAVRNAANMPSPTVSYDMILDQQYGQYGEGKMVCGVQRTEVLASMVEEFELANFPFDIQRAYSA